MKRWCVLSAALLALQAEADIYKCSDAEGNITYQTAPCQTRTLGTVKEPPPVSEQERQRAQEQLDRMVEESRQHDVARERERKALEEQQRLLAEQEAREQAERERRARLEQLEREQYYWDPWRMGYPWNEWNKTRHGSRRDSHRDGHHRQGNVDDQGSPLGAPAVTRRPAR